MFFESILKRKEDMRKSIMGTGNQLYHSNVRPVTTQQNGGYPTWNNQQKSYPSQPLKKSNSLSQFKKDALKGSILAKQHRPIDAQKIFHDSKPHFSKYQQAQKDISLLRNGRSDPAIKFNENQVMGETNFNKNMIELRSPKMGFEQIIQSNRNLIKKCEFQDKQIEYLKNQSKNMRESRVISGDRISNSRRIHLKQNSMGQQNIVRNLNESENTMQKTSQSYYSVDQSSSNINIKSPLSLDTKQYFPKNPNPSQKFDLTFKNIPPISDKNTQSIIDNLTQQNRILRKQVDERTRNLTQQLKGKQIEYEINIDKLKFENNNLKNKVDMLDKKIVQLNGKTKIDENQMFKQIKILKQNINKLQGEKQKYLKGIQHEKNEREKMRNEWNCDKKQLLDKIQRLKKQNRDNYDDKMSLSNKFNQLVMDKMNQSENNDEVNRKNEQLWRSNRQLNGKIDELKQSLQYFKINQSSRIDIIKQESKLAQQTLYSTIRQYQQTNKQLSMDKEYLHQQIIQKEQTINMLEDKLNGCEQENSRISNKVKDKNIKIQQLKEKLKQKQQNIEEMLDQIQQLKQNVFAKDIVIREKRNIMKQQEENNQKQIQLLRNQIKQKQQQIANLQTKLKSLEAIGIKYAALEEAFIKNNTLLQQKEGQLKQNQLKLASTIEKLNEYEGKQHQIVNQHQIKQERLSFQIKSVEQELASIKQEMLEKHKFISTLCQILNLNSIQNPSIEDILVQIDHILQELSYMQSQNLTQNYRQILSIFGVSQHLQNCHDILLHEINSFKENQKNMVNKIKLKQIRIDDLQRNIDFLRKNKGNNGFKETETIEKQNNMILQLERTVGEQDMIRRQMQKAISQQNEEIIKYRLEMVNHKYQIKS